MPPIRRPSDAWPKPLLDEYMRLARLPGDPVELVPGLIDQSSFECKRKTKTFIFDYCNSGQDFAGLLTLFRKKPSSVASTSPSAETSAMTTGPRRTTDSASNRSSSPSTARSSCGGTDVGRAKRATRPGEYNLFTGYRVTGRCRSTGRTTAFDDGSMLHRIWSTRRR